MNSAPVSHQKRKRRRGADAPDAYDNENIGNTKRRTRRRGAEENNGTHRQHNSLNPSPSRTDVEERNGDGWGDRPTKISGSALLKQSRPDRKLAKECAATLSRESSNISQISLNCIHNEHGNGDLKSNKQKSMQSRSPVKDISPTFAPDKALNYEPNEEGVDDYRNYTLAQNTIQGGRKSHIKLMAITYFTAIISALIWILAIFHTVDFNHRLDSMKKRELYYSTIDQYKSLLKESNMSADRVKQTLTETKNMNTHLKEAMVRMEVEHKEQIGEYRSIFKQHDNDLNEALGRIKVLRGDRKDHGTALDMAWLRMDELLEENNELSHHLNEAKKQQLFVARDKELINTVESLTQQLTSVSDEKDNIISMCDDLNNLLIMLNQDYELLEFTHHQLADLFSPILTYVRSLQLTSEQQHAIILELTSLAHSLHTSLALTESDAQIQSIESNNAVDAIAAAAGKMVSEQTARYDLERSIYMEQMERTLARMEDEALGAVQAVAEAAGKLEYERKIEEETRWRSYVEEVERTLGSIGVQTENDLRDESADGLLNSKVKSKNNQLLQDRPEYNLEGLVETSVLRAAISRRIEEGIASLQKYIHPYNYLKEKKSYHWEIKPTSEE